VEVDVSVESEIDRATQLGQQLEDLVVKRGAITLGQAPNRDRLLLAHWSLVLDYGKGILALLRAKFYAGAFALLRPLVEGEIRAHIVLCGSDEDVAKITSDDYKTNFKTVGTEIDQAFGLMGFFDKFLNGAKGALHSFTHSGLSQLGRRFKGPDLDAHYEDDEIIELIHTSRTGVFMVTNLVCKHFKFDEESGKVNELFLGWGKP
jgi:hypothetical protein